MDERRKLKEKLNQAVTRQQKRQAQREYSEKYREVKRSCKNNKRTYANNLTRDAEEAACKGDIKMLYNITYRSDKNHGLPNKRQHWKSAH